MSILQIVLDEPDIRNSLVGVPIYLHTMITYAAVFLLKVQQKWKAFKLGTDQILIRDLITRIINLLNDTRASERHLTRHIAVGLSKVLERFSAWEAQGQQEMPTDSTGEMHHPDPNNPAQQIIEPTYGIDFRSIGGYSDLPLYDEQYFPMGFFDIMSSTQFGTQGDFYQNGHQLASKDMEG